MEYFESSGSGVVRNDGSYSIDGIFDSYYLTTSGSSLPRKPIKSITWDQEKQMEQEIREELTNEISSMDLSFSEDEKDVSEESAMQDRGVCGVGARYRAVTCVRDDDVIVHPR